MKAKRQYYAAEPPYKLREYATSINRRVSQELESVAQYVDTLHARQKVSVVAQFTKFYDGEEEVAALLQDVLTTAAGLSKKQYLVYSSAEVRNQLYVNFRTFTRQRIQLEVEVLVLSTGKAGRKAKHAERRQLSVAPQDVPAAYVIIYGNKVAQISLPETGYIQAVVVEDAAIAALQRLAFMNLWKRAWRVEAHSS